MPKKHLDDLEYVITQAMKKVNVSKETNLSSYIPGHKGHHLHHISFLRLKKAEPTQLKGLIKKHILEKEQPEIQSSIPRRKKSADSKSFYLKQKRIFGIRLRRTQIEKIIAGLEIAGSEYNGLIEIFRNQIKEEEPSLEEVSKLIRKMIQDKKVDKRLISTYERLIQEQKS